MFPAVPPMLGTNFGSEVVPSMLNGIWCPPEPPASPPTTLSTPPVVPDKVATILKLSTPPGLLMVPFPLNCPIPGKTVSSEVSC